MSTAPPPPDPDEPSEHRPPPHPPPHPPGWSPYPGGGYAPFGHDPATGVPYSDKSRVVAGLLQLLPAFLACVAGVGRLYAGQTALGVVQLVCSVLAWIFLICLFWLIVPIFLFGGMWLWGVIDGVVLLAARSVDGSGRILRP